jgi:hypothetical protein
MKLVIILLLPFSLSLLFLVPNTAADSRYDCKLISSFLAATVESMADFSTFFGPMPIFS